MISDACNSGGLSNIETGGNKLSDCNNNSAVTKMKGTSEKAQKIRVNFFLSSSDILSGSLKLFIVSNLATIILRHLFVGYPILIE